MEEKTSMYIKQNLEVKILNLNINIAMFDSFVQKEELRVKTFFKMITNTKENERVIGFHAIGMGIDEMMQGVGVAMKAGATKRHFDETIAIHPTASEEMVLMDPKLY